MAQMLVRHVPDEVDAAIRAQLPGGRGREALVLHWLSLHALGDERALALLHLEQVRARNAERRGGPLRGADSIAVQLADKTRRFYQTLASGSADGIEAVNRLAAVLYYVGCDYLARTDLASFEKLSHDFCQELPLAEEVAWECTWRKYDRRAGLPEGWRQAHQQEDAAEERALLHQVLTRAGVDATRFRFLLSKKDI
jgi:hypothetical protein